MFRLIIVEDEDFIRETIANCIDWAGIGFEVEQAEDGEVALRIAERFRPDVIVTDIRMPIMDGLELTAEIKKRYPETLVVILSGYDEFRYAQEALSLGVLDYITKPILPHDFTKAMRKLHGALCERRARRAETEKLQIQLHRSLPLLRERFFNHLITRRLRPEAIAERMRLLELEFTGKAFTVFLFSADDEKDGSSSAEAAELLQFALFNVVSEEIGRHGHCFNDAAGRLALIYMSGDPENEDRDFLFDMAEKLRLSNQFTLHFTITIAIGATVRDISELGFSYETAVTAFEQQLILGIGRTYDYRDFVRLEQDDYDFFSRIEELITCFHFKRPEEFLRRLNGLTAAMTRPNGIAHPDSVRVALIDLLNGVHRILLEAGCALSGEIPDIYSHILSMSRIDELVPALADYLLRAKQALGRVNTSRSAEIISLACGYIKQNYSNPELSLHSTAAQVFISPVYLSTLFKRELNMTFVDYVSSTRLERAKLLLEAGGIKNYEVAGMVGYNDAQYFSNCFKKYTGMTPSEYRAKVNTASKRR